MTDGYETDFHHWTETQAGLLRTRSANALDWDHIAEEIESLGNSYRRDLASRIQTVLDHLIRLRASPAMDPRRGWKRTLIIQRDGIHKLLSDSPSLRPLIAGIIAAELPTARRLALLSLTEYDETPTVDVAALSFTEAEVLG